MHPSLRPEVSDPGHSFAVRTSQRAHAHPAVSLQQMVLFGQNPSQGTLLRGSQFLLGELFGRVHPRTRSHPPVEELPVRLAHRVKELDQLPHNLSDMPSINKVKNWYAQSFEVRPRPRLALTLPY